MEPMSESSTLSGSLPVMASELSGPLDQHFACLTDPRRGKVTYPLINIVVQRVSIALCATIAGPTIS